jgi:FixJ family two-component response regulator
MLTYERRWLTHERHAVTHEVLIAIVDDNESVREAATNLFRSMGFATETFASAEEFLSSRAPERASCLVLDVQMPGMDGLDLQRHLLATGRRIPIVFVTGYPDDGVRSAAMQSGAIWFLTKPFNEGDLLDGLRSALTSTDGE